MPRKSRKEVETKYYHIMTQGIRQEYIFNNDKFKKKYIHELKKYLEKYDIMLICYCIMDNHSHLLIRSEKMEEISEYMRCVNTTYAGYYNKINNRKGYVFRNRFNSQPIFSEKQMYTCINYIYNNPVKAGICDIRDNYLYSNYSDFVKNNKIMAKEIEENSDEYDEVWS